MHGRPGGGPAGVKKLTTGGANPPVGGTVQGLELGLARHGKESQDDFDPAVFLASPGSAIGFYRTVLTKPHGGDAVRFYFTAVEHVLGHRGRRAIDSPRLER